MVLSIILTLSLVLFFTVFILLSWSRQHGYKSLPPGPTPIPVLGTPQYMDLKNLKNFKKLSQEYGSVYTVWRMSEPVIVLCGFEAMKDALINHAEQFSARPIIPVNYIFSKGYDIAGPRWRSLRRFTMAFLKELGMGKKTMEMKVLEETKYLIQAVLETGGKPFNPTMSLSCALGNNITVLAFGEHFDYQDKTLHELLLSASRYIKGVNSPLSTLCNMVPVLLKIPTIRHKAVKDILYIETYVTKSIKYHKENFNPKSPKDYIDHFLMKMKEVEHEPDPDFCDTSLLVVAVGFLAGGVDTTSATLKFMLTLMAHLPDVQAKVHQEIDEVTKSLRPPEIGDKPQMPFTNAVIHETQRVVDIAPTAFIHATTEEVKFRGYTIPKGTPVIPFLTSVLMDPSQWETPDEFNPGHFLDEDGQFRTKLACMPFSVGKRACPGEHLATMQLFLFFTSLLQKFTFTLPPGTERQDSKFLNLNKYQILAAGEICAEPRTFSK
ncbi:cytochrome P450 2C39-like [Bufo gargarizans]|uniref:cytochrome P450 2C39-like n=1 Tax=Bufo gargarizans TaxID=30331 RepID=UPI001CF1DC3C|nr:cytochrome P450 2C39-like [Bufo gargarizans]XP_044151090.1 cytochrome P450 2C39-like [Bufo gargarizans]